MADGDERPVEFDEFAMFQARSMGVETEYLEMAKAGRLAAHSPRVRRSDEDNPGGASAGRRRQQRSAEVRLRSARGPRTDGDEAGRGSPRSNNRHGASISPRNRERIALSPGEDSFGVEDNMVDIVLLEVEDPEARNGEDCQSLHRSHSYRSKQSGNNVEEAPRVELEIKGDLKRTLTMPAKRHRSGTSGRDCVRSCSRPRDADNYEDVPRTRNARHAARGSSYRMENGEELERGDAAWRNGGTNGHNVRSPSGVARTLCLTRHDSSGSHQLREELETLGVDTRRTGHEGNVRDETVRRENDPCGQQMESGGKGRVAASRVERPSGDVTVYKVLVLGSQGVGKSTVTQQLLSAGNDDDTEDDLADRIVSVQVDDDESFLEFIDIANCQGNRAKQCVDANLVVYSVTDGSSFAFAQTCLQELRPAKRHNVVILVANKQDLVRNRVISEEDGKNLAAKRHCKFIEVSALLSLKMDDLLVGIARQIRLRKGRASGAQGGDSSGGPGPDEAFDTGFGCLQRAAMHAIRKVFRRRPVESTSCDNLFTP